MEQANPVSMKNAAISVLGEICGLGAQKSLTGQPVPGNQTDQSQGHDTSRLWENILTAQREELPKGADIVLEDPPLGVEPNPEMSVKCYETGNMT